MLQQVDQGLKQVDISAPSRFHLTLVDLHSHFSGRIDGGAGITLGEPRFNVSVSPSRTGFEIDCRITDPDDRAEAEGAIDAALKNISQQIGLPRPDHGRIAHQLACRARVQDQPAAQRGTRLHAAVRSRRGDP